MMMWSRLNTMCYVAIFFTLATPCLASIDDGAKLALLSGFILNFNNEWWGGQNGIQDDPCTSNWRYIACDDQSNVIAVYLGDLDLVGQLHSEIGSIANLQTLNVSGNQFSGPLPSTLGSLSYLNSLDVSNNNFSGPIPPSLGNVTKLAALSVANNSLSGTIPSKLAKFSCSSFSGNPSIQCSRGKNGLCQVPSCGVVPPPPPPAPPAPPPPQGKKSNTAAVVGGSVGGAVAAVLILTILVIWWIRPKAKKDEGLLEADEEKFKKLRKFTFMELSRATKFFDPKQELGVGGFGRVYKGTLPDGTEVAIKRLAEDRLSTGGVNDFLTELENFNHASHRYVLRIIGFCADVGERMMVFPFMANGSVASHLRGNRPAEKHPLSWETRKRIAMGTAEALQYLHTACTPKLIHCDMKSDNILLSESMEPCVADFGLATLMDHRAARSAAVKGTVGYLPPEYFISGQMSEKTDVYGYGVMLLEITTGRPASELNKQAEEAQLSLQRWVGNLVNPERFHELMDPELESEVDVAEVENLVALALLCTEEKPTDRPTMAECVGLLHGPELVERWAQWHQQEVSRINSQGRPYVNASSMSGSGTGSGSVMGSAVGSGGGFGFGFGNSSGSRSTPNSGQGSTADGKYSDPLSGYVGSEPSVELFQLSGPR